MKTHTRRPEDLQSSVCEKPTGAREIAQQPPRLRT